MQMPTGVVMRRTAELVPYANNARTHTPEQVQQIAASMREFGFTNPVLISGENDVIAGHLYDCLLGVSPSAVGVDFRRRAATRRRVS